MDREITDAEIQSFEVKLTVFGDGLLPGEQTLLSELLRRAGGGGEDVEAHAQAQAGIGPWLQMRGQVRGVVRQVAEDANRSQSATQKPK